MSDAATARALHRLSRPLRHRAGAGWLGLGVGAAALLLGLGGLGRGAGLDRGTGVGVARVGGGRSSRHVVVAWLAWRRAPASSTTPAWPTGWRSWAPGARARSPRCSTSRRRGPAPRCWRRRTPLRPREVERRGAAAVEPIARPVRLLGWRRSGRAGAGTGGVHLRRTGARGRRGALASGAEPGARWWRRCGSRPSARWWTGVTRSGSGWRRSAGAPRPSGCARPGEPWHPVGVRLDSLGQRGRQQRAADQRRLRPGDQRHPGFRHGAGEGAAARLSRSAHRHRALPALPGSRVRAGADRWRHAAPAGGNPARDQGRGDRAAHGRRLGSAPIAARTLEVEGGAIQG